MTPVWASILALLAWLVLAGSALRARKLSASTAVRYALLWGAIFLAAAMVFAAVGWNPR